MSRIVLLLIFFSPIYIWAELHEALSPVEADAIIAERESAKAASKAKRLAELDQAEVLSQGEDTLPDGRKVIIREVAPPEPVGTPLADIASVESATPEFTAEQQAWIEAQAQLQTHKVQMLSCSVHDRSVTEVRWKHEGQPYRAYTNADFNYLRGVMSVSTETDRYDYFMGIGNVSGESTREPLPTLPAFSPDRSEYVLAEGDPAETAATGGLEALLAHYDANREALKTAYQRNEALTAAQKRYDEANPKEPEDFILQFWVPEKEAPR